jgi:hypothetical protein
MDAVKAVIQELLDCFDLGADHGPVWYKYEDEEGSDFASLLDAAAVELGLKHRVWDWEKNKWA